MKRTVIAVSAFALLSVSCSSGTTDVGGAPLFSTTQPAPQPPAHIGDTLDLMRIGNGKIAVQLLQVINPATVADGMGEPGKPHLATKLTITNTGTSTVVGNANSDVAVVGSDEQTYTADFAQVSECTNFVNGEFLISPGDSVTGCVVFALPPGVTPAKVKYMPSSGISHDVGEWLTV